MKKITLFVAIILVATTVLMAQSGTWTHHSYWHQKGSSAFDYNAWIVEIDSFVPRQMTCNVSWNGIGVVRDYPGDPGHIGRVSGDFTAIVPAYPGRGSAIIYRAPIKNLRPSGFSENTICKY